jgi:integrase
MRVQLKGINPVPKRLADGSVKMYWYAWRGPGAPRLHGEPGSPEFIASYNAAVATKVTPPAGVLPGLLTAYLSSSAFAGLVRRTREDYVRYIGWIEEEIGDFPLKALSDKRSRGVFLEWRDNIGLRSTRQADYAWMVLNIVLNWAKDRGLVTHNPCERGGKLYHGTRVDKIWSLEDEANFIARAPKLFHLPLLLAIWTGQRQGDLLRLPWSAYDGRHIRLKQSKTGVCVKVPVCSPLRIVLDEASSHKISPLILTNTQGRPWTTDTFGQGWRAACRLAGITGLTFHDLRGTAVTRFALANCTVPEIVTFTGHSLRDVHHILDAHYLNRDPALAANALAKLEANIRRTNSANQLQTARK